ncbi:MAG: hypothetical protein ACTSWN_12485 [Promethearchaeota archaeon]
MTFRTLIIKDYRTDLVDWTTKIEDTDVAFIIDDARKVINVWNGKNASMINKYKAGMIAFQIKSKYNFYAYKIVIVNQGEESGPLKVEVEKLLKNQGTPAIQSSRLSFKSTTTKAREKVIDVNSLTSPKPVSDDRSKLVPPAEMVEGTNPKLLDQSPSNVNSLFNSRDIVIKPDNAEKNQLSKDAIQIPAESFFRTRKKILDSNNDVESRIKELVMENEIIRNSNNALRIEFEELKKSFLSRITRLEHEKNELKAKIADLQEVIANLKRIRSRKLKKLKLKKNR